MKEHVLFGLVIVYTLLSRFWAIGKFPILIDSPLPFRLFTATFSILGVFFLYFYTKTIGQNKKIALLSAFLLASLPWSFEQGRIVSPPSNALTVLLFLFLIILHIRQLLIKIVLSASIPIVLFIFYPQVWLFRTIIPNAHFLENVFALLSPDFLFFHNFTFWWGGVREVGILYFSLLPFFLIGIYQFIFSKQKRIFIWMILILLISSASPFFPESREFFLILPFMCIILAKGIHTFISQKTIWMKWSGMLLLFIMIYEMMQFFHYYTVHHSQQVESNKQKIHEAF